MKGTDRFGLFTLRTVFFGDAHLPLRVTRQGERGAYTVIGRGKGTTRTPFCEGCGALLFGFRAALAVGG